MLIGIDDQDLGVASALDPFFARRPLPTREGAYTISSTHAREYTMYQKDINGQRYFLTDGLTKKGTNTSLPPKREEAS